VVRDAATGAPVALAFVSLDNQQRQVAVSQSTRKGNTLSPILGG
jgi:hypothetical protein